ncbi:MAG: VOC family protein [Patescibacteria group bacterium]
MLTNLGVHIKVNNFKASYDFYTLLGFKKVFEYGPDKSAKEDYSGATFEVGGCKLEIANGHRAVKPEVFKEHLTSSKLSLMVNVDALSALLTICSRKHIQIAVPPRHFYWGTLELVIKDPDGTVLVFIAPYSAEEAAKVNADETFATKPKIV